MFLEKGGGWQKYDSKKYTPLPSYNIKLKGFFLRYDGLIKKNLIQKLGVISFLVVFILRFLNKFFQSLYTFLPNGSPKTFPFLHVVANKVFNYGILIIRWPLQSFLCFKNLRFTGGNSRFQCFCEKFSQGLFLRSFNPVLSTRVSLPVNWT